jgi:hypothetical protein
MSEEMFVEIPLELEDEGFDVGDVPEEVPEEKPVKAFAPIPDARPGGAPGWVKVPQGMRFPRGRQVAFIKLLPQWTDAPHKGERQCIVWGLTDIDEKMAMSRAMGDPNRVVSELTKQMIRSVDGAVVDWSGVGGPGSIDQWWRDIGGKCRQILIRIYTQMNVLPDEDRKHFFENCIELRLT